MSRSLFLNVALIDWFWLLVMRVFAAAGLSSFILYPGTRHGFAVRGSRQDAAVNAARQDALQQAVSFFGQHLTGEGKGSGEGVRGGQTHCMLML